MEQTEIRKKFPIGSILLWLAAAPYIVYFFYSVFNKHLTMIDFSNKLYAVSSMFFITVLIFPLLIGLFSLFCNNKGLFFGSAAAALSFLSIAVIDGSVIVVFPMWLLMMLAIICFDVLVLTQAFKFPEKLKKVCEKLFFLPSLFVIAATVWYVVVWSSVFQHHIFNLLPGVLLALASLFILRRAVDPYKKQKAAI